MRLTGRAAVVTGSSRGVGRSVALAFAREGADVLINYSASEGPAQEVVEQIRSMGRKSVAVRADVASGPEVEKMMAAAKNEFGRLDILVNNAGFTRPAMLHKMTEDQWVAMARTRKGRSAMPWYNLNSMSGDDLRSLYRFVRSLGPATEPASGRADPNP